jgi:hypothetical protein
MSLRAVIKSSDFAEVRMHKPISGFDDLPGTCFLRRNKSENIPTSGVNTCRIPSAWNQDQFPFPMFNLVQKLL